MISRVGIMILLVANKDIITDYSPAEDTRVSGNASFTKFTATGTFRLGHVSRGMGRGGSDAAWPAGTERVGLYDQ